MNELLITKVSNGYLVKTVCLFGPRDMREIGYTESWVFEDLRSMYDWLKDNFNVQSNHK